MKGFVKNALILACSSLLVSAVYANDSHKNNMQGGWICETNASSSNNPKDTKADEEMQKMVKKGGKAFMFAYEHCRDCTKITCTLQKPQSQ